MLVVEYFNENTEVETLVIVSNVIMSSDEHKLLIPECPALTDSRVIKVDKDVFPELLTAREICLPIRVMRTE